MRNRSSITAAAQAGPSGFPEAAALAALRAWHEGLSAREAVARYLGEKKADGQSSRAILGGIRRELTSFARLRHRTDLVALFEQSAGERLRHARAVNLAIEQLRTLPAPAPLIGDDIALWLPSRVVHALLAHVMGALAIALIGQVAGSMLLACLAISAAGFCVLGGQTALNALAAVYYPTSVRSTGMGWALGIGRLGSIFGPVIGGELMRLNWVAADLFLAASVPALLALGAILVFWRSGRLPAAAGTPTSLTPPATSKPGEAPRHA